MRCRCFFLAQCALLLPALLNADDGKHALERERYGRMPEPSDGYDWHSVALTRKLTPAEIEKLGRDKLLIGRTQFRQSFEPYVHPAGPMFITSDSLLNAFHVLFEDSFRNLEFQRASDLRLHLESLVEAARTMRIGSPYPQSDLQPGWIHAQRALGPAMVFLGTSPDSFDPEVRGDIAAQIAKIRAATSIELPFWLEPRTSAFVGIDYRRMRPVGFYANDERLADYFRAVRWLQTVPFRIGRDDELSALLLLAHSGSRDPAWFADYERLIGPAEGESFTAVNIGLKRDLNWAGILSNARSKLRPILARSMSFVNDDLRVQEPPGQAKEAPAFHILRSYRLPDAALFQYLVDRNETPTGLQMAAMIGSSWARSRLTPRQPQVLDDALKLGRGLAFDGMGHGPLYNRYLAALGTLFDSPDPDAPAFMRSDAWSAKSCQTALAGWAQMRHTFTLQAKQTVVAFGVYEMPPGFIEPNPRFLRRMAELVQSAEETLRGTDTLSNSNFAAATRLRAAADMLETLSEKVAAMKESDYALVVPSPIPEYNQFMSEFGQVGGAGDLLIADGYQGVGKAVVSRFAPPAEFSANLKELSSVARSEAVRYEQGQVRPRPANEFNSLSGRWATLQHAVERLEILVQVQLRRQAFDPEDSGFLKGYGSTIAAVMGYFGNEYTPRDDSQRWAEVVRDPGRDDSLAAATGRPRPLYVLYPWNGMEVLCEGSVIPYYEDHSKTTLTDAEWREKLGSPGAPPEPAWIRDQLEVK